MSHSTKRAVSVKVHFTQAIFFLPYTSETLWSLSIPSLLHGPTHQRHDFTSSISILLTDNVIHRHILVADELLPPILMACPLWHSWLSVQWEHLHTMPTWQLDKNHGIYIFFFFQVVTSGLLADLAPICFTDSIANDCATIPGSCSGSDT